MRAGVKSNGLGDVEKKRDGCRFVMSLMTRFFDFSGQLHICVP